MPIQDIKGNKHFKNPPNWRPFEKFLLKDWGPERGNLDFLNQPTRPTMPVLGPGAPSGVKFAGVSNKLPGPGSGEDPGILSRIFASLDAPQNAVINTFENFTTDNPTQSGSGEFLSDLGKSLGAAAAGVYQISPLNAVLGGKFDKVAANLNPANSVAEQLSRIDYFDDHPWQREGLGFIGDIATDPLTYVPFLGWGKFAGRAAKTSEEILKGSAERAGIEESENIVGKAVRGEKPVVKSNPTDVIDEVPVHDPVQLNHVIDRKPTAHHLDDLTQHLDDPKTGNVLKTDAAAQKDISESFANKVKEERDFLADDAVASATKKVKVTEDAARETSEDALARTREQFDQPVAGGLNPQEMSNKLFANFYSRYRTQATERLTGGDATKLTPKIRQRAHEEALVRLRQAEDTIAERNLKLEPGSDLVVPFHFGDHQIKLSHALSRVKVSSKTIDEDIAAVDQTVTHFAQSISKRDDLAQPLRDLIRGEQVSTLMRDPNFMNYFHRAYEGERAKVLKKAPHTLKNPDVQIRMRNEAVRKAVSHTGLKTMGGPRNVKEINKIANIAKKHIEETQGSRLEKMYANNAANVRRGRVDPAVVNAGSKHLEEEFGQKFREMHDVNGTPLRVPATIGGRLGSMLAENFTTFHGKMGLDRPIKSYVMHALQSSRARMDRAKRVLRAASEDDIKNAFTMMQRDLPMDAMDPKTAQAYGALKEWMTHMMGSADAKRIGVVQRSQALMDDVNKELNRLWGLDTKTLRFSNKAKVVDKHGKEWDFSENGLGWTESWKAWDIDELMAHRRIGHPANLMFDVDLALTSRSALYAGIEDAASRFGRINKGGEFTDKVYRAGNQVHPMLADKHFHPDVAHALNEIVKHYEKGSFAPNSEFGRFYQKALRAWKSGVTIYNPSHHIRNFFGDMWMTWMAGYNSPYDFYRGVKVMRAFRKNYNLALEAEGPEALMKFTQRGVMDSPSTTIFRVGRQNVNASHLYQGAYQRGLLIDINDIEDIGREGIDDLFNPQRMPITRGRIRKAATQLGMYREHTVRLHHFTAATRKLMKKGKSLEEAMDEAAMEVRKWHPDGTDLTYFEQKWGRNVFPFYSWTRKAIPLIAEGLWKRPGKIMVYPRGQYAISSALGFQEGNDKGLLDPFPESEMYADWLREGGVGPIGAVGATGLAGMLGGLGNPGMNQFGDFGTTIVDPGVQGIPFNSVIAQNIGLRPGDIGKSTIGSMNPAFRITAEALSGQKLQFGSPIEGPKGYREYAMEQVPLTATLGRLFPGAMPWVDAKKKAKYGSNYNREDIINWFTAAGITGSGQYRKSAEFQAKERATKNAK